MEFPYFRAPMKSIEGLANSIPDFGPEGQPDNASCSLCGQTGPYLFIKCDENGTGGALQTGFFLAKDIDLQQMTVVPRRPQAFPVEPDFYYRGCLDCLSRGRFTTTHGTETGWIRDSRFIPSKEDRPVTIPQQAVDALARTPEFSAWQVSIWLEHCHDFMVYLGEWGQEDFNQYATDGNGQKLHTEVVQDVSEEEDWEDLRGNGFYVFKCSHCHILRSYSTYD